MPGWVCLERVGRAGQHVPCSLHLGALVTCKGVRSCMPPSTRGRLLMQVRAHHRWHGRAWRVRRLQAPSATGSSPQLSLSSRLTRQRSLTLPFAHPPLWLNHGAHLQQKTLPRMAPCPTFTLVPPHPPTPLSNRCSLHSPLLLFDDPLPAG